MPVFNVSRETYCVVVRSVEYFFNTVRNDFGSIEGHLLYSIAHDFVIEQISKGARGNAFHFSQSVWYFVLLAILYYRRVFSGKIDESYSSQINVALKELAYETCEFQR